MAQNRGLDLKGIEIFLNEPDKENNFIQDFHYLLDHTSQENYSQLIDDFLELRQDGGAPQYI